MKKSIITVATLFALAGLASFTQAAPTPPRPEKSPLEVCVDKCQADIQTCIAHESPMPKGPTKGHQKHEPEQGKCHVNYSNCIDKCNNDFGKGAKR